ncbi:MAG TPA: hypothetical protein VMF59_08645 [Bacteroidota bacterium]|nr:hypothetical protein [Bacteroidota bacterium]
MKHAIRSLLFCSFAAVPLLLLSGCYTQMGTARGDSDEGYDSHNVANDETTADSTQPGDYESARREFYNDSYYPYPAYSVGIGFGWNTPWYGYGYPWYFYDSYPFYGGFYPYGYWYPHAYPGYYGSYYHGGGGYSHYGRPYATRRFGMVRSSGGSRSGYITPTGGHGVVPGTAGRTGTARGVVTPATAGRRTTVNGTAAPRGRGAARVTGRSYPASRGTSTRSAPAGTSSGRSGGGRVSSAPAGGGGHAAPSGGSARGGGGGGGSRGGSGGGGGGSRGGGGRR